MKSIFFFLACIVPALAQEQPWIAIDFDGTVRGDWTVIRRCAERPFPTPNEKDTRTHSLAQHYFAQSQLCRSMLAARHAGWIAAGGNPSADPYPPSPMHRPDDFKIPLECDYSGLNKDGVGFIRCNVDTP